MSVETYKPKVWQPKVEESKLAETTQTTLPFFVTGVVNSAAGSVYYENGSTKLVCAVYGPKQNTRAQYSDVGVLSCDFRYAPFALDYRRRRGKNDPEETNISIMLKETLSSCVQLDKFPKHEIQVYVIVLERGNNETAAAVNAASLALIDSGVEMFDLTVATTSSSMKVSSPTGGKSDDYLLSNPSVEQVNSEECRGVVTLAHMPSLLQITLLTQTGKLPISSAKKMIELNIKECAVLAEHFKKQIANNIASNFGLSETYSLAIQNAIKMVGESSRFGSDDSEMSSSMV